jgi:hypothetical protein
MIKLFILLFHGIEFTIPKGNLIDFFEHRPELITTECYEVQSSVPLEIFEAFVKTLETGENISVTDENADPISLLAKEFCLDELLSKCTAIQAASAAELTRISSESVSQTDNQTSSRFFDVAQELRESITTLNQQLDDLRSHISELEGNLAIMRADLEKWKSLTKIEFPLKETKSVDGIISYLTQKHG